MKQTRVQKYTQCGKFIFDKGAKTIQWKKILLSVNCIGKTGHPSATKMNRDLCLTIHKINPRWFTDLTLKCRTSKLLEENIGENLCDCELSKVFLDLTPKA